MSVGLTDSVVPLGNFPAVEDGYIGGGYHIVANNTARDSIMTGVRKAGMVVKTVDTGIEWVLLGDLVTWAPKTTPGSSILPVNCVALVQTSLTGTDFSNKYFDGVTVADGYRILLCNQTDGYNGIYVKTGANLVSATDVISTGSSVYVISGDYYGNNIFYQTSTTATQSWKTLSGADYVAPLDIVLAGGSGAFLDWLTISGTNQIGTLMEVTVTCTAINPNNSNFIAKETRSGLFKCGNTLTVIEAIPFTQAPDSPVLFRMKPLTSDSKLVIQVWKDPDITYSYRMEADVSFSKLLIYM